LVGFELAIEKIAEGGLHLGQFILCSVLLLTQQIRGWSTPPVKQSRNKYGSPAVRKTELAVAASLAAVVERRQKTRTIPGLVPALMIARRSPKSTRTLATQPFPAVSVLISFSAVSGSAKTVDR
jgi:hypothetical protein